MRCKWIAVLLGALTTAPAGASPPSASQSTIPHHVVLVALESGTPDRVTGEFLIVVRDATNNPVQGSQIEVRFHNCSGARVASDQRHENVTSRCVTHGILTVADLEGNARLTAVGGGDRTAPHGAGPCASVFADGVLLGIVPVSYLDQNGSGGLGAGDLSVWVSDWATGEPIGRSDYNGDGALGALDLSLWLTAFSSGRQAQSATSYCP